MTAKTMSGGKAPLRAVKKPVTSVWMKPFLAQLAATSNVAASARAAKVSASQVYEARRSNPEFYRQWQVALCEGYDHLEMEVLARLRVGELKPLPGAKKATRQWDNAIALRLLAAHGESAARERALRDNEDSAAVLERVNAKLDLMRERAIAAGRYSDDEEPAA